MFHSQFSNVMKHSCMNTGKVNLFLFFDWPPRHEGVLGEWRYSSTYVVSFTTRPLYPQGKSPSYRLDRRLGGLQSQSERGGEEKNSPITQPVAQRYTTEVSLLLYEYSFIISSDATN
jgi:hypothetical protein